MIKSPEIVPVLPVQSVLLQPLKLLMRSNTWISPPTHTLRNPSLFLFSKDKF